MVGMLLGCSFSFDSATSDELHEELTMITQIFRFLPLVSSYSRYHTITLMSISIQVPENYGYVVLSCVVGAFVTSNMIIGGDVMKVRTKRVDIHRVL